MQTNHFLKLLVATAVIGGLVGCGNDTTTSTVAATCPTSIGGLTVTTTTTISGSSKPACLVPTGVMNVNANLDSTRDWVITQLEVATANLTIQGNTNIYATTQAGSGAASTSFIFINTTATINTQNTSASAPVKFSSLDTGYTGRGEWGGVFIRSIGANRLDHVVVTEAGTVTTVAGANYSANILIRNATSQTILTFVQSHDSNNDGIQLRNTDARLSWILVTGANRDGIWYQDFGGIVKDYMAINYNDTGATPTGGRAGIYASESGALTDFNPRFVNVTLFGGDDTSINASNVGSTTFREFGILFANNTNQGRFANIAIANYRNGCYEVDTTADVSGLDAIVGTVGATGYLDGVHCANSNGNNGGFGAVRTGGVNLPATVIDLNNNGLNYYRGANNPIGFTASGNFTASWYVTGLFSTTVGIISNGGDATDAPGNILNNSQFNRFHGGDTDGSSVGLFPTSSDNGAAFIISNANAFNLDVAVSTGGSGGYDLTHIGAIRSGSAAATNNRQFDGWTVGTTPLTAQP